MFTDHSFVEIGLDLSVLDEKVVGPGYWKCNNNVLKDLNVRADLEKLWNGKLKNMEEISSEGWDSFKKDCGKIDFILKELIRILGRNIISCKMSILSVGR